jgi:DNA-binding winged helix-turn-helix (wHTH) protein
MIRFTDHARRKFKVLEELGFEVREDEIGKILRKPLLVQRTWKDRFVAVGSLDFSHMLRIVFEKENGNIVVVTFYPVRRSRYES